MGTTRLHKQIKKHKTAFVRVSFLIPAQRGRRSLHSLTSPFKDKISFPHMARCNISPPAPISKNLSQIKYVLMALQGGLFAQLAVHKITGNSLPEVFPGTGEKIKLLGCRRKYPTGSF